MILKNCRIAALLAVLTYSAFSSGARAQSAPAARPMTGILSISLPPNSRLRMDIDARDDDLLGVVKSFMRGINGSTLKQILPSPKTANGDKAPVIDEKLAMLQLLSDADLNTMLQDINHLRVVAFETPYRYGVKRTLKEQQATITHYSQAYLEREGGRRVAMADFDDVQMLTVGFPKGGLAFVMQGPGFGFVVRADGYPNLEAIGPLAMAIALRFSSTVK